MEVKQGAVLCEVGATLLLDVTSPILQPFSLMKCRFSVGRGCSLAKQLRAQPVVCEPASQLRVKAAFFLQDVSTNSTSPWTFISASSVGRRLQQAPLPLIPDNGPDGVNANITDPDANLVTLGAEVLQLCSADSQQSTQARCALQGPGCRHLAP